MKPYDPDLVQRWNLYERCPWTMMKVSKINNLVIWPVLILLTNNITRKCQWEPLLKDSPWYPIFSSRNIVTFCAGCCRLLDRCQEGPISSVLLVIIGWLVAWLVGNAVFSKTASGIFLIFCMKLGDYKERKVTEPAFWKKNSWFGDIREKVSKLVQNQKLCYFSQKRL